MQVAETFTFPLPTLDANRADADNSPDQQGATNGKRKGQGQRDQKHDHGSDQVRPLHGRLTLVSTTLRLHIIVQTVDGHAMWQMYERLDVHVCGSVCVRAHAGVSPDA